MNRITSFISSTYHAAKKYVDKKISKNPKVEAQREKALFKKEVTTTHNSFNATLGEHSKAAYRTIKGQWDKAIGTVDNRTKENQHLDPNERARPIAVALKIQRTELNRLREQKPRLSSERVMLNNNITLLERSIATLFNQLNQADISTFSEKRQIEIFNVADPTTQETLFRHLTDETVAKILNQATNSERVQFAQNHPQKYYQIVCVKHREALNMYVPNEFTVVGQAWSRLSHVDKADAIKEMSQDEVNQILSYKRNEHLSEIFDELVKQQPLPKEACVAVLRNMNRQVRSEVEVKHENICKQLDYQRFIA